MHLHRVKKEARRFDRLLDLYRVIKLSPRVTQLFVERFN